MLFFLYGVFCENSSVNLIVPDYTSSVYGSSCNYVALFMPHSLSISSISLHSQGRKGFQEIYCTQKEIREKRAETDLDA